MPYTTFRKSDANGTLHFKHRFEQHQLLASVLSKICEHFLEKNKQYELSSLVFVRMLLVSKFVKSVKRGKWWVRLCIDVKHLKMRKECLNIAEVALQDI